MGLIKRVDRYVLMGILVCLPFILALAVLGFVAELLGTLSGPVVTWIVSDSLAELPGWTSTVLTIAVALILFGLLGWLAAGRVGQLLLRALERLLDRLPVAGSLFRSIRQLRKKLAGGGGIEFRHFVMAKWNQHGWLPAFVTGEVFWPVDGAEPKRHFILYVPNTHVVSGSIRVLPEDRVRFLDASVDEGVACLLTAGLTLPDVAAESKFASTPAVLRISSSDTDSPCVEVV